MLIHTRVQSTFHEIEDLFAARGSDIYGERVTQLQHAVQTAAHARARGGDDQMVVACLLHDIGHLIHDDAGKAFDDGIDDLHEELGARWLASRFPAEVTEPARLHVASKRYLCAADPDYSAGLSDASRKTLEMQGGPMSPDQCAEFESGRFFERAVELRRCDDLGKDPEDHRERIADYHAAIIAVLEAHHADQAR